MSLHKFEDWLRLVNEQKAAMPATVTEAMLKSAKEALPKNRYTLANRPKHIYRIASNKWQFQKRETERRDIWFWVTNLNSVLALNKKYKKDLLPHVDIKSKPITDLDKLNIIKQIKKSGKEIGWTDNAIASIVGNVGRETGFRWKYIAGTHTDLKNKKLNFGIISWQGARLDAVKEKLKEADMLEKDENSAKEDLNTIDVMIKFMNSELDSQRGDSKKMTGNYTTKQISDMLKKYIRYSGPPYNQPDDLFNCKKNHYWAAAAKLSKVINYT